MSVRRVCLTMKGLPVSSLEFLIDRTTCRQLCVDIRCLLGFWNVRPVSQGLAADLPHLWIPQLGASPVAVVACVDDRVRARAPVCCR